MIATATELFEARHYPGVVAMCSDALEDEPECVPLLLIRGRARMALRRDLDAQADLRDVIRLDPACSAAYRLLGELAARRDETPSALAYLREALRLDPDDREAHDWLMIASAPSRPAAVANQLPASAAAAGHFSPRGRADSVGPARFARGTQVPEVSDAPDPAGARALAADDERPTRPFGRVTADSGKTPLARPTPSPRRSEIECPTLAGRPPTQPPAKPAPRLTGRGATPELPGFGEYLVANGILTRERLRAAQAYQRSMRVQLATAVVTLGLASPQRIQWAAVAHQSELARERTLT